MCGRRRWVRCFNLPSMFTKAACRWQLVTQLMQVYTQPLNLGPFDRYVSFYLLWTALSNSLSNFRSDVVFIRNFQNFNFTVRPVEELSLSASTCFLDVWQGWFRVRVLLERCRPQHAGKCIAASSEYRLFAGDEHPINIKGAAHKKPRKRMRRNPGKSVKLFVKLLRTSWDDVLHQMKLRCRGLVVMRGNCEAEELLCSWCWETSKHWQVALRCCGGITVCVQLPVGCDAVISNLHSEALRKCHGNVTEFGVRLLVLVPLLWLWSQKLSRLIKFTEGEEARLFGQQVTGQQPA